MFTGIVTDMGRVREVVPKGDTRFVIETNYDMDGIGIGASIACDGACLTVVEKGPDWFAVTASAETLARATLSEWAVDRRINLERPLRVGDELGGHIVTGHVDCLAEVIEMRAEGDSVRYLFQVPDEFAPYVASKGSVALSGVSLTVNEVEGTRFGVNVIPHTRAVTTFGDCREGHRLNMEIDILARYVARLMQGDGGR
ncbi:MAG: riboflavin synthase [Alphaproteobacteria bacterium]|jgi:riboflavin synthase|nr:riboflavin synthase [Alphaproteobacteria bacterium]